jgi:hypothetical protein
MAIEADEVKVPPLFTQSYFPFMHTSHNKKNYKSRIPTIFLCCQNANNKMSIICHLKTGKTNFINVFYLVHCKQADTNS